MHTFQARVRDMQLWAQRIACLCGFIPFPSHSYARFHLSHWAAAVGATQPILMDFSSSGDLLSRVRRSNDAVLAMSDPPPHFGSSGQVLVSGWMDGLVRIYDLRSSHRYSPSKIDRVDGSSITVPTLSPVMSMYDRESRGIGTITSGGGAGCHVAASSLTGQIDFVLGCAISTRRMERKCARYEGFFNCLHAGDGEFPVVWSNSTQAIRL